MSIKRRYGRGRNVYVVNKKKTSLQVEASYVLANSNIKEAGRQENISITAAIKGYLIGRGEGVFLMVGVACLAAYCLSRQQRAVLLSRLKVCSLGWVRCGSSGGCDSAPCVCFVFCVCVCMWFLLCVWFCIQPFFYLPP